MGEHVPAAEPTRRRRAMPGAAVRSPLDDEVLAGMLRIGYMTASQIGRLWLPRAHRSTVNRLLARLCDDGLIAFAEYAVKVPETAGGGPPRYVGHVYVVTPRGEERVKAIFPEQPLEKGEQRLIQRDRVDNPQLAHALRYSEVLVRILEALPAMPNLIGVISSSEVLLSARKYPRADGIVLLRREKEPGARVSYVPAQRMEWLRRPWDRAQEDQIVYALEIDNDTEPARTIKEKAEAYRAANASRWWQEQGMPFPTPLWIVPSRRRLALVLSAWVGAWPEGVVWGTTWEELERGGIGHARWIFYNGTAIRTKGRPERRERPLFVNWLNLERYDQLMEAWGNAVETAPDDRPLLPEPLAPG
jgi:hypothetical protein